jgi:hypothetical protein
MRICFIDSWMTVDTFRMLRNINLLLRGVSSAAVGFPAEGKYHSSLS